MIANKADKNKPEVPKAILDKYPDIWDMMVSSPSMKDAEREYWIKLFPVMTMEQVDKFYQILLKEKQKLDAINIKYGKQMSEVDKNKQTKNMRNMQKKWIKAQAKEKLDKETEMEEAEKLLEDLD